MSEKATGGPAFPVAFTTSPLHGMTLRDYFAAKAMQGMQSNFGANSWSPEKFAARAYEMADAMLEARKQ